ncbi:glycosyltransferase [Methylocystis sp. ATCC 49242]|uniref:glycosyltransferase n=1 Tax=Methylocystis sp. ATCC 49242 TaxID=622637 RepID=UPI0001F87E1A|nr:glycosyltransferase [Methylocystis sp. ATCC 49242]
MIEIAFVVPLYKHSQLVCEAIQSVLAASQESGIEVSVVIVDDGCPHLSSHLTSLSLSIANEQIYCIRGPNKGLSSARNRGIEYILAKLPNVEGIFFLDADNMLEPHSVRSMKDALDKHPDADWFYPDINMFGLNWHGSYAGNYLPLIHAVANISEAGSLVRTRVFLQGQRFDENMKSGYEDWDFWLSIVEAGFRGMNWPGLGFRYRKRPESMLADSHREHAHISNYMKHKHRWTGDAKSLLFLEMSDLPRYAIFLADEARVVLTSNAQSTRESMRLDDYRKLFVSAMKQPNSFHPGSFLVITTSNTLSAINDLHISNWILFDLERRTQSKNLAVTELFQCSDEFVEPSSVDWSGWTDAQIAMVSMTLAREILEDAQDLRIRSVTTKEPEIGVNRRRVATPSSADSLGAKSAVFYLVSFFMELRAYGGAFVRQWPATLMKMGAPDRSAVYELMCWNLGVDGMQAGADVAAIDVAFLLPILEFGGVERVACAVASALKRRGMRCHAVVIGASRVDWGPTLREAFDSLNFVDSSKFQGWSGPLYEGTKLPAWDNESVASGVAGFFTSYDVVLSCNGSAMFGIFRKLQQIGIVTSAYLHVNDITQTGRIVGHPQLALAYDHALDLVITCSNQLGAELLGRGMASDKIVIVPNAPGINEELLRTRDWVSHRRARAEKKLGLNVLLMGRFDYQKGLDRIQRLLSIDWDDYNIRFRLVGKSVIDQHEAKHINHTRIESAVYDPDSLIELLEWADVLLLPSHYEGLPLVAIEAMIAGVVTVVTETGALRELIANGENGFIVSQESCVEDMTKRLVYLAVNSEQRLKMAEAAMLSVEDRRWDDSITDLYDRLRREVAERRGSLYCEGGQVAGIKRQANHSHFSKLDFRLEMNANNSQINLSDALSTEATA